MFDRHLAGAVDGTVAAHQAFVTMSGAAAAQGAALMRDAALAGRQVLVFGNGGSATDAQHLAA